jgi:hypothetical protein
MVFRSKLHLRIWVAFLITAPVYGEPSRGGGGLNISNMHDQTIVQTRTIVGTSNCTDSVAVSIDGNPTQVGTGTTEWRYMLPKSILTSNKPWTLGSSHSITVGCLDKKSTKFTVTTTIHVAAGLNRDVNGDGYADLIVGAMNQTFLYYGAPNLISRPGKEKLPDVTFHVGPAVLLGDVNMDGYSDIILGSDGSVEIFFGGKNLPRRVLADQFNVMLSSEEGSYSTKDHFGNSFAIGDVDGDGLNDIIVGGVTAQPHGAVYVFYGKNLVTKRASLADVKLSSDNRNFVDLFGMAIIVGDYNSDGVDDIIVRDCAGSLWGFFGGQNLATNRSVVPADRSVASADLVFPDAYSGCRMPGDSYYEGWRPMHYEGLAMGDVNGDGKLDLLVNTYYSALRRYGAANLFYNGHVRPDVTFLGKENGPMLYSVALGDMNGDGLADVLVGASGSYFSDGAAYGFYGSQNLEGTVYGENADIQIDGLSKSRQHFGYSATVADLNGDGHSVILIGTQPSKAYTGSVYGFFAKPFSNYKVISSDLFLPPPQGDESLGFAMTLW